MTTDMQQDVTAMAGFADDCQKLFQGEGSLAARRGITSDQLDGLFGVCYERYLNGDYDSACKGFQLLCIYEHQNPRNWQGYGYSLLGLKDYRKAATSLAFAGLFLDVNSTAWAEAHLHIVKALLHAGQRDDAEAVLQELIATASDPGILNEAATLGQVFACENPSATGE